MKGRTFQCHFWYYTKQGVWTKCGNTACWAGIRSAKTNTFKDNEIYIDEYKEPETEKHVTRLVWVINRIYPCSVVTVGNKEYIKLKLRGNFNKDLLICNFIRNLWYTLSYSKKTYQNEWNSKRSSYSENFFKFLAENKHIKDPIARLTDANAKACESVAEGLKDWYDLHSNAVEGVQMVTTEEFEKWDATQEYGDVKGMHVGRVVEFLVKKK